MGNTTSLARLVPCPSKQTAACVKQFVATFGPRAWRRPLTDGEVQSVVAVATLTAADTLSQATKKALVMLLISPQFLYRIEPKDATRVTGYPLAARLSYFLWSTTPDDTLLAAAGSGALDTDDGLAREVDRMLADPKAQALRQNFLGQWLLLRSTQALRPDPKAFPKWSEALRGSMLAQTDAVFAAAFRGERSLQSVLDGNTTFVDNRLASFYGMPSPNSDAMVEVPAEDRRGLLDQAAVLAATSTPTGTSIVHRGLFVLDSLLCTSPGGAPSNIPPLPSSTDQANTTQRQRLDALVQPPACLSCHRTINPYGEVLEPYDAIGASRTQDNGISIDPTATLANGTKLDNAAALRALLTSGNQVANCFTKKMVTYGLGRRLGAVDAAGLQSLQGAFLSDGQRVNHLVRTIALSPLFRQPSDRSSP